MKKQIISAFSTLFIVGSVSGSTLIVENGWNLVSTAGNSGVTAECILDQLQQDSLIWIFDNKGKDWSGRSNNESINNVITSYSFSLVETIEESDGFWLFNTGSTKEVDLNCTYSDYENNIESIPNFIFGNELAFTAYDIFKTGNVLFSIDSDGYDRVDVKSPTNVIDKWYEFDENEFILQETMDINITVNSDNNFSYALPDGEKGDIIINYIKEILAVDDENVSGLKYISVTSYVTQEGEGYWEIDGWQPTYYDNNLSQDVQITDIITFKNQFIDPNGGYWNGEPDNDVWMFAASDDKTITNGDIVKAQFDGYWDNCTPTNEYDCKKFIRTNEVIGSWSLQSNILTVDLPNEKLEWKFDNGKLYRKEVEKIGSTNNWFWLWGDNPDNIENEIRIKY
ncbi:hypothetical protein RZR97_09845 [Hydrogenimonas thermophila]|uniref:hypothetical protein n=1 Tax=Hydrogenimonas thermophila TaxID=223786 RepID=UPI002936FA39|nr:hypothetical protein [Hydrogenimonas thermophila]WOE69409.1 hypothetical protein RZR91_09875 [Hydrogenimonas thermophila]WOE71918.1 hypothetical protein RZR97_09845 [Hydrogenimonas thermophila]